jgi:hypothetical protein
MYQSDGCMQLVCSAFVVPKLNLSGSGGADVVRATEAPACVLLLREGRAQYVA